MEKIIKIDRTCQAINWFNAIIFPQNLFNYVKMIGMINAYLTLQIIKDTLPHKTRNYSGILDMQG
jgi:hypothetical protein